jgi:Flp pilus assembly protein TadD
MFAVHPLHVESVAWIAERKDVLSTMLWLLTIWAYVVYVRQPNARRYATVALLFALGLMAKPMLVTLPFVLVLLDYWPLGRVTPEFSGIIKSVQEKLPLIALAVASSIVTFAVQLHGGAVSGLDAMPLGLRVENALVSYVTYMAKLLWPAGLAALYPLPKSISGWEAAGSIAVLIGISVAVFVYGNRRSYIPMGWLWYLGTLVPVIGLVQVGRQSMADRYTYVPTIGLFIIVAWGACDLLRSGAGRKFVLPAAAMLVIAASAVLARIQVGYWQNATTLWERAISTTDNNYFAHYSLGFTLAAQGNNDEAIGHYREALRIKPGFPDAETGIGSVLVVQGKISEAADHFTSALRAKPDLAEAHNGMGNVLIRESKSTDAAAEYAEALRISPQYGDAHNGMGVALALQGRTEEAVREFQEALRLKPNDAGVRANLARVRSLTSQ